MIRFRPRRPFRIPAGPFRSPVRLSAGSRYPDGFTRDSPSPAGLWTHLRAENWQEEETSGREGPEGHPCLLPGRAPKKMRRVRVKDRLRGGESEGKKREKLIKLAILAVPAWFSASWKSEGPHRAPAFKGMAQAAPARPMAAGAEAFCAPCLSATATFRGKHAQNERSAAPCPVPPRSRRMAPSCLCGGKSTVCPVRTESQQVQKAKRSYASCEDGPQQGRPPLRRIRNIACSSHKADVKPFQSARCMARAFITFGCLHTI